MIYCLNCNKELPSRRNTRNKYCDNHCQQEYQNNQRINDWLYDNKSWGEMKVPNWAKKHLININGRKCSSCDLSSWKDLPITLEVNHIDGDAANNNIKNLELLCPNCHSITDTYKGKNRGNGRKIRYGQKEVSIIQ